MLDGELLLTAPASGHARAAPSSSSLLPNFDDGTTAEKSGSGSDGTGGSTSSSSTSSTSTSTSSGSGNGGGGGSSGSLALEEAFRFAWSDNADAMAKLYAGTGALKGDFTRRGKRTKQGLMADGANSMKRYYMNHFRDPTRQEVGRQLSWSIYPWHYFISAAIESINESIDPSNSNRCIAVVRLIRRCIAHSMNAPLRPLLRTQAVDFLLGGKWRARGNPTAAAVAVATAAGQRALDDDNDDDDDDNDDKEDDDQDAADNDTAGTATDGEGSATSQTAKDVSEENGGGGGKKQKQKQRKKGGRLPAVHRAAAAATSIAVAATAAAAAAARVGFLRP